MKSTYVEEARCKEDSGDARRFSVRTGRTNQFGNCFVNQRLQEVLIAQQTTALEIVLWLGGSGIL